MTDAVHVEIDGHVATIEFSRPPANFFDQEVLRQIADAATELVDNGDIRAIVLASAGKHFCAGANFGEGGLGPDRADTVRDIYTEALRLFEIPVPVIAAVQGSAVGGGLGLACAADFRVAGPSTRLHANFAALGFHQGFGLSVTLPRVVGAQTATGLLYTARRLTGTQAHELGLVDRLADDTNIREQALAYAHEIAANAPLAVRSMKETLRGGLRDDVAAVLERELAEQVVLWGTEDCVAGIEANLARQQPQFSAR